jgi:hypothetical protein
LYGVERSLRRSIPLFSSNNLRKTAYIAYDASQKKLRFKEAMVHNRKTTNSFGKRRLLRCKNSERCIRISVKEPRVRRMAKK